MPEDFHSLDYCFSLAPSSLHFCLIKKPNHADGSERITSRSLRMFEDAKATRGKHMLIAPGREANTVLFFFNFNICSLKNLQHLELSGVSNPKKSEFSRNHNCM